MTAVALASGAACVQEPEAVYRRHPVADASYLESPPWHSPPSRHLTPPDLLVDDGGFFGVESREGRDDGHDGVRVPGSGPGPADDTADGGYDAPLCPGPLATGDLAIVELMIRSAASSVAGGDRGEWLELQSTRRCTLDLSGLRIESPRPGGALDSVSVGDGFLLPPGRTLVVAASAAPATNHALPGVVLAFPGDPADVLDDAGDTITLVASRRDGGPTTGQDGGHDDGQDDDHDVVIDRLTYPRFDLEAGRSIAFPADCSWGDRASWARWSYSFDAWFSPSLGTPNSDNTDVACY